VEENRQLKTKLANVNKSYQEMKQLMLLQSNEIKTKLTKIKNVEDEVKNKVAKPRRRNDVKQDLDTKISTIINAITQMSSEVRDQTANVKDGFTSKISGIQQQLVVQSTESNNIIQSVNQLKTITTEIFTKLIQQPLLQHSPQQQSRSSYNILIN